MSIKKRIFSFVLSFLTAFSVVPNLAANTYAADGGGLDAPISQKTLSDNGDGTYQLSLSVTGKAKQSSSVTKANVVIVLDTSGSMNDNTPEDTRLDVAKSAVLNLSQSLLAINTSAHPDLVEVAIIDFATRVKTELPATTNLATINSWLSNRSAGGGTNWENALSRANQLSFNDNDPIHVVFISDGNPTFRDSRNGGNDYNYTYGLWGNGTSDPYGRNLDAAITVANAIKASGKKLYAVGVFGNVANMQQIGGDAYYNAVDAAAINSAFTNIAQNITDSVAYTKVQITDELTNLSSSAVINGNTSNFSYTKTSANGQTSAWYDAPAASLDGQRVNWDLGNFVLENGTTYTVSFTVWPSQASLDLVSDLTNGLRDYASLTAAEQNQVVKDADGNYRLKTNTDATALSYSTITTVTNNGQTSEIISGPQTVAISNPDPVALDIAELNLRKIWLDGLDATQRADVGDTVVLDLQQNGVNYLTKLTLSRANDWVYDQSIAIAPGIMISHGPAFDAGHSSSFGGKNYTILESGHDYRLLEHNINDHYEFKHELYHPMWVDGTLMNVLFGEDGTILDIAPLTELSATNTLKGGINIEKIVVDQTGTILNSQEKFTAHVELKNPDGSDYAYTYRIFYGPNNPLFDSTYSFGDPANRSAKITGTAPVDLELYAGDQIRFVNVDTGVNYRVSETSLPFAYSLKEIKHAQSYDNPDNYTDVTPDPTGYLTVTGNTAHKATLVNTYHQSQLEISKVVEVVSGDAAQAKSKTFNFTVNLTDSAETPLAGRYPLQIIAQGRIISEATISSGEQITLKDGQRAVITQLPAGAHYSVAEDSLSGFQTTAHGTTGTLAEGQGAKAEFVNTYAASGSFTLTATKLLKGRNWLQSDSFTFNLINDASPDDVIESVAVDAQKQTAEFQAISLTNPGIYHFTIFESPVTAGGFTDDTDVTPLKFTVTAIDNGAGEIATTITAADGAVTNSGTITNTYSATGSISLVASKILTGRDWLEGENFTFSMLDAQGRVLSTQVVTRDNKDYVVFDKITYNTEDAGQSFVYIIRESSAMPTGMTNSGDAVVTVTVIDQGNGELTAVANYGDKQNHAVIINHYTKPVDPNPPVKVKLPDNPHTSDHLAATIILLLSSLLGLLGASVSIRRKLVASATISPAHSPRSATRKRVLPPRDRA